MPVEFTVLNQSSTSIQLKWNSALPDFLTKGNRGFNIDYFKSGDAKVYTILFCESTSSYVFSNLTVFTNYCYNVVAFNNEEIDTKRENTKCAFTDEEGKGF